ncbi:hypothetical protein E2C01_090093 [Portunus trituberculatus]|uniref:Uncharacterized protein n=1 Tax=Portunus trituberculatus TaxID=210409 RepID=A0A5B7JKG8_PORTR|nr:hypothetical protein [Portunus trituberculatus]
MNAGRHVAWSRLNTGGGLKNASTRLLREYIYVRLRGETQRAYNSPISNAVAILSIFSSVLFSRTGGCLLSKNLFGVEFSLPSLPDTDDSITFDQTEG